MAQGFYELKVAKDGQFMFNLKAANGQVILTSELYKTKASAENGIASVQKNGVDAKTVSSMLRRYDAGFTLRTYTHATRQKQDEAAQAMGSFMAQVM